MTVYFAEEVGTGNIKIGFTESGYPQDDRIDTALTMTSHEVVVRAVLHDADRGTEQAIHRAFGFWRISRSTDDPNRRSNTEFFRPSWQLWSLIGYVDRTGELPCRPRFIKDLIWDPRIAAPRVDPESIDVPF